MEKTACCHYPSRNRAWRTHGCECLSLQGVPAEDRCHHALGRILQEVAIRIQGPEKIYTRVAQEGRKMNFDFCPNCGSSV